MTVADASGYRLPVYEFRRPAELGSGEVSRHPVIIIGGGLCGLTVACDLAIKGVPVVVLDEDNTVGVRGASSRGIVYAQKSLEIFDRLGIYERILAKGVTWSVGKTLAGDDVVYSFDAGATNHSRQPPFINIQQFYVEWFLVDRIGELEGADLRWNNRVTGIRDLGDCMRLDVETPVGTYQIDADWVLDCEGVHSVVREALGIGAQTSRRHDRWCISDVRFRLPLPAERWTWVEAPFNENRAVWQHLMADDVWRMDFQMDPQCDLEEVSRPEVAAARLRAHLGDDVNFELVWVGPYSYRSFALECFRHGRVFFLGDTAHQMSPFGARGGNSGIQDADNLAWKLALVLGGRAGERLLDSYDAERRPAAVENVRLTHRTNRFLSPDSAEEKVLRDAVLALARRHEFARPLVNTGRLSVASAYGDSPVIEGGGKSVQNLAIEFDDGRIGHLADLFRSYGGIAGIIFGDVPEVLELAAGDMPVRLYACGGRGRRMIVDPRGLLTEATGSAPGTCVLLRPDLHMAATIPWPDPESLKHGLDIALGGTPFAKPAAVSEGDVGQPEAGMQVAPNIPDPDGFYESLADAHAGLSPQQSAALNARLVFLLANQIGDGSMLLECIVAAREGHS